MESTATANIPARTFGSRVVQTVGSAMRAAMAATTKQSGKKKEFRKLVQHIASLDDRKLVAASWNEFQKMKAMLTSEGGRYGTLPTREGQTTHQVKFDHEDKVLTLEYVTAS